MNIFKPFHSILPQEQTELLPELKACTNLGFTLYGGTAIALQLGHRRSVDFDFFSDIELDDQLEKKLLAQIPSLVGAKILQKEPNTRTYLTKSGVKVSFFGGINFGRVGQPRMTDDDFLSVASLDDLMGTKLAVILQRVEAKDYIDIAAMLRHGCNLGEGLAAATALYGEQFTAAESLKALTYFKGGDLDELTDEDKNVLVNAVKKFDLNKIPMMFKLSNTLAGVEKGLSR